MSNRGLRYNRIEDMPQGMQQLVHKAGQLAPTRGPAEHQVHAPVEKRPKYGNVITTVDGIRFDSKREARYYEQLKLRQHSRSRSVVATALRSTPAPPTRPLDLQPLMPATP